MSSFQTTNTSPFNVADNTTSVTASLTLRNADGRVVGPLSVVKNVTAEELTLNDPFGGQDRMIIDAGFAFGRNWAILNLSGTGTPSSVVECLDNTTGNWNVVATVQSDGTWQSEDGTAIVTVDPNYDLSGAWYKVNIRYSGDSTVVESTNTFLPGFVVASVAQSERDQFMGSHKNKWFDTEYPLRNRHNLQILKYTNRSFDVAYTFDDEKGTFRFSAIPEHFFFNDDAGPDDYVNSGMMRHMSNLFDILMPNIPVLLVDQMWSGSGKDDYLIDWDAEQPQNSAKRDFRYALNAVMWCRERGTEIGLFDEMWYASNRNRSFDYKYNPLYTSVSIDTVGNTFDYTLGDNYVAASWGGGGVCENAFFDCRTGVPDNELGQGILRKDRSKLSFCSTNWFISYTHPDGMWGSGSWTSSTVPSPEENGPERIFKNNGTRYAEIEGSDTEYAQINFDETVSVGDQGIGNLRGGLIRFLSFPYTQQVAKPLGLDPIVVAHGEMADGDGDGIKACWNDMSHPSGNIVRGTGSPGDNQERALDGHIKMLEYFVLNALRSAELIDFPIPRFVLSETAIDGSYVKFSVEDYYGQPLPAGSRVETLRSLRGQERLRREDQAYYKEIMGFELLKNGLTEGSDWTREGFDTVFDRTTDNLTVKIIPDDPFENGDTIRFSYGGSHNYARFQSDTRDQVYKSFAILHIPSLAGEDVDGTLSSIDGIPIAAEPRTEIVTLSGIGVEPI